MASNDLPENSEYADFASRVVRGFARRVGEGDVDALPSLLALRDELDEGITQAVAGLRAKPNFYSWQEIADRLGVTRQAVMQRWPQADKRRGRRPGGQPASLR